jgi:GTP1/Obg family GTP-binding protein
LDFREGEVHVALNLLGYDAEQQRVRDIGFRFLGSECNTSENQSGVIISGFVELDETPKFANKLFSLMDGERTLSAALAALSQVAREIETSRTEPVIGPPYSFTSVEAPKEAASSWIRF